MMTKQELADLIGVSRPTLNTWEKEKTELVRLINLGLQTDKQIQETRKLLEKLEEIEQRASSGKFQLK
jgi:DNA-binding XRE family transcriptional regulator